MAFHFKHLKVNLGKNVRALRKRLELSQEELADLASLDRTYISQLERAIGNPSLEVIARIANVLKATPGSLLDDKHY